MYRPETNSNHDTLSCACGERHSLTRGTEARVNEPTSVQVKQGDYPPRVFGLPAGLQQQVAIVEGEADDLLDAADDVAVADPAAQKALCITWSSHAASRAGAGLNARAVQTGISSMLSVAVRCVRKWKPRGLPAAASSWDSTPFAHNLQT